MKLINCLEAKDAIAALVDQKLPFSASYNIMLITEKIEKDEKFYHEQVKPLINKYGIKDEKGEIISENGSIQIQHNYIQEFNELFTQLQQTEVTEPEVKLSKEDLKEVKLTPRQLFLLKPFME